MSPPPVCHTLSCCVCHSQLLCVSLSVAVCVSLSVAVCVPLSCYAFVTLSCYVSLSCCVCVGLKCQRCPCQLLCVCPCQRCKNGPSSSSNHNPIIRTITISTINTIHGKLGFLHRWQTNLVPLPTMQELSAIIRPSIIQL